MTALTFCRVVLVRPRIASNLGAVARAMRNLGLSQLVLVEPYADAADERALLLATHAEDILRQAQIVAELGEAVADCALVAATSANVGGPVRRQSVRTPRMLMPEIVTQLAQGPVALVFGPERTGLSNDEIARCHYLLHIPTAEEHAALNLAQAVAICLYELRLAWLECQTPVTPAQSVAPFAEQERMFARLEEALTAIHFLYGPKAATLMHALRHLLGRAQPSPMEVKVLLGLARQLCWLAEQRADVLQTPEEEP